MIGKSKFKQKLAIGDVLLREGDEGECAFFVERGRLEVTIGDGASRMTVGRVGPGGMVGEMSLITGEPYSATVTAVEKCAVIRVSREYLDERMNHADPMLRHILKLVMKRFRKLQAPDEESTDFGLNADTDQQAAVSNLRLENAAEEALENGELELHYQPIMRLADDTVAGFEALIRWHQRNPERMVSPAEFIPVIERSPLILRVGHWIFATAAADLATLSQAAADAQPNAPAPRMNVNIAARQFEDPQLFQKLEKALRTHAIDPENFQLEVTESMLLGDFEGVVASLSAARKMRFKVAIDDFGTGYSSLSYLHRLPATSLKLDQVFIRELGQTRQSRAIVNAVTTLGRDLGMKIVAEGIETRDQANALREIGVDYGQGYYFGRPMPLGAAIDFYCRSNTAAF